MNSSSPANSSISTTAIVGGGGASGRTNAALEDSHFPSDLISIQDRKDEAMLVLKSDLMAALNEEVKSLDEDNWKFEGPRSRIHLISRPAPLFSLFAVLFSILCCRSDPILSYSKEKQDQSSIRILPKKLIMHKAQGCILNTRLNVEFSAALTFLTERRYFRALQGFTIHGAHSYRQQGGNLQVQ
ncbi:hypothetical protein PVK06_045385 [Gossypium arboreum]|uniref:Protein SAMBA n=1 Tax=Gossypium arboreum TaxID=29729 RepID=A0ABR0MTX6_GOSAR|nr:hypothetical protein PVK06_045385 [Gossypium arboreum]